MVCCSGVCPRVSLTSQFVEVEELHCIALHAELRGDMIDGESTKTLSVLRNTKGIAINQYLFIFDMTLTVAVVARNVNLAGGVPLHATSEVGTPLVKVLFSCLVHNYTTLLIKLILLIFLNLKTTESVLFLLFSFGNPNIFSFLFEYIYICMCTLYPLHFNPLYCFKLNCLNSCLNHGIHSGLHLQIFPQACYCF